MTDRRRRGRRFGPTPRSVLAGLSAPDALAVVYELLLHRAPDPAGAASYLPGLEDGTLTPAQLAEWILSSGEWWTDVAFSELGTSLHFSRCLFVRSFPPARRILDLGGTALGAPQGAMVRMGYPYAFDRLVVVDLPQGDRNDLYREDHDRHIVDTPLGPVHYHYHSMTDLSAYPDASFDLVYSGQSIEHVPVADADKVLTEVARVLRPGGHLALDTPNATVCRLQQAEFIDPDHDHEYTHHEMVDKLRCNGFEVVEMKGLNHAGRSLAAGEFSTREVATQRGLFADIESCYLLAYLCRTPEEVR
ncbi:MAG TPA: methyltransferase domain-containing protein [Acidimicrobiales bacterium]|nr:methyltransferase domain-containing protein [Acidimicrobiales bacterium]